MPKIRYKSRIKYLPDRIFHKIWDIAEECSSKKELINRCTSPMSGERIRFYASYRIDDEEAVEMLENIWNYRQMSFKDLLDTVGMTPSQFRHIYCIPKQTIAGWSNGRAECRGYIILMVLKHNGKFILGKRIRLESERVKEDEMGIKEKEQAKNVFVSPGGQEFESEEDWLDYIDRSLENIHK